MAGGEGQPRFLHPVGVLGGAWDGVNVGLVTVNLRRVRGEPWGTE